MIGWMVENTSNVGTRRYLMRFRQVMARMSENTQYRRDPEGVSRSRVTVAVLTIHLLACACGPASRHRPAAAPLPARPRGPSATGRRRPGWGGGRPGP